MMSDMRVEKKKFRRKIKWQFFFPLRKSFGTDKNRVSERFWKSGFGADSLTSA
jgi:hypothetical protein